MIAEKYRGTARFHHMGTEFYADVMLQVKVALWTRRHKKAVCDNSQTAMFCYVTPYTFCMAPP